MQSFFLLASCIALFCSKLLMAEQDQMKLHPRFLDQEISNTHLMLESEKTGAVNYERPPATLQPTQIAAGTENDQTELESPLPTTSAHSVSGIILEEIPQDLSPWVPSENEKPEPRKSEVNFVNKTLPYALINSSNSQQSPTSLLNQPSPTAYGSGTNSSSNLLTDTLTPSILGSVTSVILQSPAIIKSTSLQTSVTTTNEPKLTVTVTNLEQPSQLRSSSSSTILILPQNTLSGANSKGNTSIVITQTSDATQPSQTLSSTTGSIAQYPQVNPKLSNSTLTPTLEPILVTEISSTTIIGPTATQYTSSIIFSNIDPSGPAQTSMNTTQPTSIASPAETSVNTIQPALTTTITTPTSIESSIAPLNSSSIIQTSTFSTITTSSTAEFTYPTETSLVPITSNSTYTYSTGFSTVTTSPQQSFSDLPNSTYTSVPLSNITSSYQSSLPSNTQISLTTIALSSAPTIIMPTATNTESTFIPSSIIAQTSASYTSGESTTKSTGIPSALPKIVQNPLSSSTPAQPDDTSEVQIGFDWALNYPFVVSHPLSTSQIFTYLPIGIADGLGLKPEKIVVKNLLPLDTTAELQFITTVARVFIPTSMVDTLRIDLGIAASLIYQNPDESINTLMNYINPAIPFFPGGLMDPGSSSSRTGNLIPSTSQPGDTGVFNTGTQQPQSAGAMGATAGIALAACGGAAAYGAAMFLLARRYKYRQQKQSRSNNTGSPDSMDEANRPMSPMPLNESSVEMTGGRISPPFDRHSRGSGRTGHSARTAQISVPMMAENSLGWN